MLSGLEGFLLQTVFVRTHQVTALRARKLTHCPSASSIRDKGGCVPFPYNR